MAKGDHLKGVREATQFPHNDPTKGGRKPSIRTELKRIAAADGELKIPRSQIIREDDETITIKLPKKDALALKLFSIAMQKRSESNALKAIQILIEQIDDDGNKWKSIKNNSQEEQRYKRKKLKTKGDKK